MPFLLIAVVVVLEDVVLFEGGLVSLGLEEFGKGSEGGCFLVLFAHPQRNCLNQ